MGTDRRHKIPESEMMDSLLLTPKQVKGLEPSSAVFSRIINDIDDQIVFVTWWWFVDLAVYKIFRAALHAGS